MQHPIEICIMCERAKTMDEIMYLDWCEECTVAWARAVEKLQQQARTRAIVFAGMGR